MNASILQKLEQLAERHQEVGALLSQADIINVQDKFRSLSQEYSQLEPIAQGFATWQQLQTERANIQEMLSADDSELKAMAEEEWQALKLREQQLTLDLQILLIPSDPLDNSNIFLEVRAGTGGDEAAIFAGDLFRMYCRYAELKRWQVEILSENIGEHGGYKEVIARLIGQGAYSRLKFESGVHRVQRVPATESQGRVHTSAATVAILPELAETEQIQINPADLKVDTFRASGAGGQHINKTDSAIRITHLPSGMVVECQDERSQHKNRARALSLLSSRLLEIEREKEHQQKSESRRLQVGSGDRSERIRTYNFPQGRVTDHRINLTLYKIDEIIAGELDQVIDPLNHEHQADLLAELAQA